MAKATDVLLVSGAYGRRVGLRVPDHALDAVLTQLPFWWDEASDEPEIVWDVETIDSCQRVVRDLEFWVAEHAVDVIFVHAGVVGIDGKAILIPGRSFSGKSTLVAALLQAGAQYGSDEYAVIDSDGLVHAYPRPLTLRDVSGRPRLTAADLGASTLDDPVPPGLVAILRYEVGADLELASISSATAALHLLDNTLAARSRGAEALVALTEVAKRASCFAGQHSDAAEAAQALVTRARRLRST